MAEVQHVWRSNTHFHAEIGGEGWSRVLRFPINELAQGASLARMMTLKVRQVSKNDPVVADQEEEFKEAASAAIPKLREIIEPYFAVMSTLRIA